VAAFTPESVADFSGIRRHWEQVVPPGTADIDAAYAAFVAYGKGSGHPANLNYGDLFSYALAKVRNLPLLFKGDGFAETDIRTAWQPNV
jgi:ribonuclease VapC